MTVLSAGQKTVFEALVTGQMFRHIPCIDTILESHDMLIYIGNPINNYTTYAQ